MPIFTIRDGAGNELKISGDSEPNEEELEELFKSFGEPEQTSGSRGVAPATIPDSLQLKPQLSSSTYGKMAPAPQFPEFATKAEAYGGSFGNARAPIPDHLEPTGPIIAPGVRLPEIVEGDYADSGKEIARQGKFGQFIEETAQAPIRIGMMHKNENGDYVTEMGPTEVTTGDEINPRSHTAFNLPLPSDLVTKYATKEGRVQDVSVGLRNAAAGFLNFFLSPQGIAMAGMGGGAGARRGIAWKRGDDMAPLLMQLREPGNRALAGAFSLDMAKHAPEALQAGDDAMKRGDLAGAIEHWVGGASQLALAGMSAKHAAMPGRPAVGEREYTGEAPPKIDEAAQPDVAKMQPLPPEAAAEAATGPLTPEEATSYSELKGKFFEGGDMTADELSALDAFDARGRTEMQNRVNAEPAEGMISEAERLVTEAVKAEGVGDIVEIVDPSQINEDNPLSGRIGQWNAESGKIQINGRALVQDIQILPPERRAEYIRSMVNEEAIHSRTSEKDATDFHDNASWAERRIAETIYTGKLGKNLTPTQLGYEMVRRRIQHLNKIKPTEIALAVGKQKWTLQSLDVVDRVIKHARDAMGTKASKAQREMLDRVQKNIGIAKEAAGKLPVGAPRREVEELTKKMREGGKFPNNSEAVDAGLRAESIEDLDALLQAKRDIKSQMKSATSFDDKFRLGGMNQFLREAIEAATNTGSQRVEKRLTESEKAKPLPNLDWSKNPEVADWLKRNAADADINIEQTVGAPRRKSHKDFVDDVERDIAKASAKGGDKTPSLKAVLHKIDNRITEMLEEANGMRKDPRYDEAMSDDPSAFEAHGSVDEFVDGMGDLADQMNHLNKIEDRIESDHGVKLEDHEYPGNWGEGGYVPPPDSTVGAQRRGIGKREAERIEEQRKYRELMLAKEQKGKKATVEDAGSAMSKRLANEPITPNAVSGIADEVLGSQVPSFNDFMSKLKTRHGTEVQPGQVAEAWADSVWKKLGSASGAELEKMVNDLGLRRQVFGTIKQGSKTYGLSDGPPPTLTRTGKIADAGIDTGGIEMARAKALERSQRLAKKAASMLRTAESPVSELIKKTNPEDYARQMEAKQEMKQKAQILQRTADNLSNAAHQGEGMPASQTDLFGGEEAVRPADYRDPTRGGQAKARDRAISAIGRHLLAQRPSMRSGLSRKSIGAEDVRWSESGNEIKNVRKEDLDNLDQLGYELTERAATDASTKRIAGGGRYVVKEQALPRSATKRVVAMMDTRTKKVYLVSAFRDGRRGPVFLDPLSATGEHRTLDELRRFRPIFSIPLDSPVQNFRQEFGTTKEFIDKFYGQLAQMSQRIGFRGAETRPTIEGTEGLGGQGGMFMGPEADLARAELSMVEGARESGADLTPQEGRAIYDAFRPMETREDVATMISKLRQKAEKNKLQAKDWLLINAMAKVNDAMLDLYRAEGGEAVARGAKELTSQQIADLTLQELYDLSKRNQTEQSFVNASQRQFAEGLGILTEAGKEQAAPSGREVKLLRRRPPTDVSRAEPGQPEVATGADPNRPAGLQPPREPKFRRKYQSQGITDYSQIIPQPQPAPQGGKILDYMNQKRPPGGAQIETGRVSEITPMAETPGPRESYVSPERKIEITQEVNKIADKVSGQPQPQAQPQQPAGPQQSEMTFGAMRRIDQHPKFWDDKWKDVTGSLRDMLKKARVELGDVTDQNFFALKSNLNGIEGTLRQFIRETGLQIDPMTGEPLWETVRSDRFNQAAHFMELLQETEKLKAKLPDNHAGLQTDMGIGSLRRQPGRTIGEQISNVLTDFGSIYDKWMVDRLDEYGGPVTRGAVRQFRGMIDRQKELYGQLTPLLDRARRLSGGIDTNRGTNLRSMARDLPRQAAESARAMRAASWMGGVRRITDGSAIARSVEAVEGNINVPPWARNLVTMIQAANLEVGRMMQAVVPGFVATGRWQRNITGLGYDIIRMGAGPLWDQWIQGTARANRATGASNFTVRRAFEHMKELLDDPMTTADQIEHVNQEMARQFPNAITHVRAPGRLGRLQGWQEIVHSNPFNYLEQTAQRATHIRAFREQFPNTDVGRRDFRTLVERMTRELPDEAQRDLHGLIRALNGHPTDEYGGGVWTDLARMNPQQAGGIALRGLNQTMNNVLSKSVLSGQMVTQLPELAVGATPQKLGVRNYIRAMARVRSIYTEMELFGAVNRVMHDYTFSPNSPIRSIFKIAGNVISKATMQSMLNELQEAMAAVTARVTTEDIVNNRLSDWQRRQLPQTFREMGFNAAEVQQMMAGDQTLLGQFQRKAAAYLTSGNKAVAENSRPGASRMFNSIFRFQSYPMMKMNQTRNVITSLVDAWHTGQNRTAATESAARFFIGNAMQGAGLSMLASLMFGGKAGLEINANEANDEKFKFLGESFLAALGGPLYLLWRGARQGGMKGVGEQSLRTAFPYAMANDIADMRDGVGAYQDKDTFDKIGTFISQKTPGVRLAANGLAMFGIGHGSRPLDQAIRGLNRWKMNQPEHNSGTFNPGEDKERDEFRKHVLKAIDAMKDNDTDRYVDEWMKAVDAKDADSFKDSMRQRKLLTFNGKPLTEEQTEALQRRIGMNAYNRLEWYDIMLDAAAKGAIPPQP